MLTFSRLALAGLASLVALPALAEDNPEAALTYRKAAIGGAGYAVVTINNIRKGELPAPDSFVPLAQMVLAGATNAKAAFAIDTHAADLEETTAKPNVWSNWDDFSKRMDGYIGRAETLLAAAEAGNVDEVYGTVGQMFRNDCKGCHDEYRTK